MRVVFIGTVEFSKSILLKLIDLNVDVVGVCLKRKSNFNSDFADLAPVCAANDIPIRYTKNINSSESINWISSYNPDIIFCFGWSSLIKSEILSLPRMGVLGFHPANLPMNRGRHPLIWALFLGLQKTASTFFFMDEGADSGDILSQSEIVVSDYDDAKSLYEKVTNVALKQVEGFIPLLKSGKYTKIPQNNSNANYWRKRSEPDGKIDFRMSSDAIYNLVRALSKPYIGAHIEFNNEKIKVWKVTKETDNKINYEPGKVLNVRDNIITVKTYDSVINIIDHDFIMLPSVGDYL